MMKTRVTTTTKKRNFLIPHKINADKKQKKKREFLVKTFSSSNFSYIFFAVFELNCVRIISAET